MFSGSSGNDLVTISNQRAGGSGTKPTCCNGPNIKNCQTASIDASLLGQGKISLPGGIEVSFIDNIGNNPNFYNYRDDQGNELTINYNPSSGGMNGHAMTSDDRSFVIENCGSEGHVFKEIDIDNLDSEDTAIFTNSGRRQGGRMLAVIDNTTVVTYSVQIYYTKEFAAVTPDIQGWMDAVIAETNQGYINSNVPLRVKKHCTEQADLPDGTDASILLDSLSSFKPTQIETLNSADVGVLIVNSFSDSRSCGVGWLDVIDQKKTFSVMNKGCALGYYTFGHEIGHNIGLMHDKAAGVNPTYSYGHGYHIDKGTSTTGYRTILAYYKDGYRTRKNYYSNPSVIFPPTGTRTGDAKTANNALLLMQQRFKLAAVGDESMSCKSTASTSAATTTVTTSTSTTIVTTSTNTTMVTPASTTLMNTTTTTFTTPVSGKVHIIKTALRMHISNKLIYLFMIFMILRLCW